jgi:MFS family permease
VNAVDKPLCYKMTSNQGGAWSMIAASITVIVFIVSMLMAGRIAESRGRATKAWIWLAAVFGPLAALTAWALPAKPVPKHAGANGD